MTDLDRAIAGLCDAYTTACLHDWDVDRDAVAKVLAAIEAQKPIGFVSVQKDGSLRRYEDTKDLMFDEEYGGYFNAPVYLAPPAPEQRSCETATCAVPDRENLTAVLQDAALSRAINIDHYDARLIVDAVIAAITGDTK